MVKIRIAEAKTTGNYPICCGFISYELFNIIMSFIDTRDITEKSLIDIISIKFELEK